MARRDRSERSSGRGRGSKTSVHVDFAGVEGRVTIPPGDYLCEVVEVTREEGPQADYLAWKFNIIDEGRFEGKPLYTNTSLSAAALWNLRNLLEAMGVEVPDGAMDLDLKDMEGRQVILITDFEDYEGRRRTRVVDYEPPPDDGNGGGRAEREPEREPEREEGRTGRGRRGGRDEPEPEREEGRTGRGRRGGRDEPEPEREERGGRSSGRRSRAEREEGDERDADRGERGGRAGRGRDRDEGRGGGREDRGLGRGGGRGKREPEPKDEALYTQDEIHAMSEDELYDLVEKEDLDVDLDKHRTLKKKAVAVIDALAEAKLIEE